FRPTTSPAGGLAPSAEPRRGASHSATTTAPSIGDGVKFWLVALLTASVVSQPSGATVVTPRFIEETTIDHVYDGGPLFAVGGGVAAFDCNDDGLPDLYIAGGSNPAALYRNDSVVGGELRFTRLNDPSTDLVGVNGAYPIDIDGDGHIDLVVLRTGESFVLRGLGDCRFERGWSLGTDNAWTNAFSATWEGSAVLPMLALGRYLRLDASGRATSDCDDNLLLRPNAEGTGYQPPRALSPGYCSLAM